MNGQACGTVRVKVSLAIHREAEMSGCRACQLGEELGKEAVATYCRDASRSLVRGLSETIETAIMRGLKPGSDKVKKTQGGLPSRGH